MAEVARLTAKLLADSAEFVSGLGKASKSLKVFETQTKAAAKVAAASIAAAAASFTFLAVRQADVIAQMNDTAKSVGISMKEFQALSLVASEVGVDYSALASSIGKAQKAIVEAAQGSKSARSAFESLGLSYQSLLRLKPQEQFDAIASALERVQNPTERTALAMAVFGKSGRDLIPILEDYNNKIKDARDFNERFNISLSEIDTRTIDRAGDTVGRVKAAFGGFINTVLVQFAPLVEAAGDALLNAGIDGEDFSVAVQKGMTAAAKAVDVVKFSIQGLRIVFQQAIAAIGDLGANAIDNIYGATDAISGLIFSAEGSKVKGFKDGLLESGLALRRMSDQAATDAASLEDAASKIGLFQDTVEGAQINSKKKSKDEIAKGTPLNPENLVPSLSTDQKTKDLYKDTIEGLKEESQELETQIKLFGQKETAIDKAIQMLKIENKFKKEGIVLSETQRLQIGGYLEQIEKQKGAFETMTDLNNIATDAVKDLGKAFFESGKLADKFKAIGVSALSKVAEVLINNFSDSLFGGKSSGGGAGGSIIGSLLGSVGSGIGSFFKGLLPSFAVGTDYVPNDMLANIHKGEMIIPASEANAIRGGGMGGGIIQNITIGAGVTSAVRQEIARMLPDIKRVTVEAVQDSKLRGSTF